MTRHDRTVETQYKPDGSGRLLGRVPGGIFMGPRNPFAQSKDVTWVRFPALLDEQTSGRKSATREQCGPRGVGWNLVNSGNLNENWSERTRMQSPLAGLPGSLPGGVRRPN